MNLALLQFAQKPGCHFVYAHRKERFIWIFMKIGFTFHDQTAIIMVTQGVRCAGTALAGLSFHENRETFHTKRLPFPLRAKEHDP